MDRHPESTKIVPKALRREIGESLRSHRLRKGYSQYELATLLLVDRSTISKIENGRFAFSIDYLEKLSWYLDFDVKLLIK